MIERYGVFANRRDKRILHEANVIVVDVHIGKHLFQHGVYYLSRGEHLANAIGLLTHYDVLFLFGVFAVNMLCHGLVYLNGQNALTVVRRGLYLVSKVRAFLEEIAFELLVGNIV